MLPTVIDTTAFDNAVTDVTGFITGTAGPALFGIALAAIVIMVGVRWLRKSSSQS